MTDSLIVICALYKFVRLNDYELLREPLTNLMKHHQIFGTLLLAGEGLNGTVAGPRPGIDALLAYLNTDERLNPISFKESYHEHNPFKRVKVRLKKEIVTLGVQGIDPNQSVGTYVEPEDWNDLISDPDVLLIDTRNEYECQMGTFKNAINPHTDSFREFPEFVEKQLDPNRHKKVAMFCTGGIRCEKSTALLKLQGFDQVYHLHGGILQYLEDVPESESMWEGECFVFDDRVSVDHQLNKGRYELCFACRQPITAIDMQSEKWEAGVSCPKCYDKTTVEQKARFRERHKQVQLSRQKEQAHIGDQAHIDLQQNKINKQKRQLKARETQQHDTES